MMCRASKLPLVQSGSRAELKFSQASVLPKGRAKEVLLRGLAWRPDRGVFPRVADCLCHRAHSNTPLENSWSRTNSDLTAQSRGTVCELEMLRMIPEACIHSELLGPPSSFSSSSLPITRLALFSLSCVLRHLGQDPLCPFYFTAAHVHFPSRCASRRFY